MSEYLSKAESLDFITQKLHIRPTEQELANPSFSLLQRISRAFSQECLYSTVYFLTIPPEERRLPTYSEVKDIGLRRIGGLCFDVNVFFHWLLHAIGFDIDYLLAKYVNKQYNHAAGVVHLDGTNYYIDVGSYPLVMENLINLDFEGDISPISRHSIFHVRVARTVLDGLPGFALQYLYTPSTQFPHWNMVVDENGWGTFIEFSLVKRSLQDLAGTISYTDTAMAPVINRLYCFRYPKGRLLLLRNTTLYYETESGAREEIHARSREELIGLLITHFGDFFSNDVAERAVDRYIQIVKSPPGFLVKNDAQ